MKRGLGVAGLAACAAICAAGVWWLVFAEAKPNPPYPTEAGMAALAPMDLPDGWFWDGAITSGGPPDGKPYGLQVKSFAPLWQGERITQAEAEALLGPLSQACASLEFAQTLVAVRGRNEYMLDLTDRQLVARIRWDSGSTTGVEGRTIQNFEVRYDLEGGVCGAVQPLGLIANPFFDEDGITWIIY